VKKRLVYICDWLPPDFGAVGQYAVLFARQWAAEGWSVTLVGLTSGNSKCEPQMPVGMATVELIAVHRPKYQKERFVSRMLWTVISDVLLLKAAFGAMRRADVVLFTGSPPLMLHFIAPLNILLGKQLVYRITDFHPECLIVDGGWRGPLAEMALTLTRFWRRRIDQFEVLGTDQARRLMAMGISEDRIRLKRDPSPVVFSEGLVPVDLPHELENASGVILYSGNWGVAHEDQTFIQAYAIYRRQSDHGLALWLNAVGAKVDGVESALRAHGAPMHRSSLVPLEDLPRLLIAVDVHLITLRDAFVGYVLPSKIHACIESGKRILFVGSESSDVHLLASQRLSPERYCRVDVGDVEGLVKTLQSLELAIVAERKLPAAARSFEMGSTSQ
jgi:Glycosyl transferase 4-like domain